MKKVNILVVDDEEDLCKLFYKLLTASGYNVDCANSGKEAIKKAKKKSYQIIFMDIKLPDINGVDAFLKIKKIRPQSSTVLMTGYASRSLIKKAIENGAYRCFYKPFNISEILDVIERILRSKKRRSNDGQDH